MPKTALITGITGQDGSYLTEFLLDKDYVVHGLVRPDSAFNPDQPDFLPYLPSDIRNRLVLHYGDLSDAAGHLTNLIYQLRPEEVYNLGAQSHVRASFDIPESTANITGLGTIRLMEAIRRSGIRCRFYQASSSEMFGDSPPPQNEQTPFRPRSPYATAKVHAHWTVKNYREGYGIFACNGIMFNHESPRRGATFVSRKIARAAAAIRAGKQKKMSLGNLEARRDWGYAPEYVEGMWRLLQAEKPQDLVFGTGETHSVREFVEEAFAYSNLDWRDAVEVDPRNLRPTEVDSLQANPQEVRRQLGWEATIKFKDLVRIMMDAELEAAGLPSPGEGRRCLAKDGRFSWMKKP